MMEIIRRIHVTWVNVLVSLLILVPCVAQGQERLVPMPNRHLLPTFDIRVIFRDEEGFMWYGTKSNGLCRDDGYDIAVFRSDFRHPEINMDNNIMAICDDGHKRLWLGTKRGLYILDKKDYRIYPTGDRELQTWTYDAVVPENDGIVTAYANGWLLSYNMEGKCIGRQQTAQRPATPDRTRAKDLQGRIWQLGNMPYPMVQVHPVVKFREVLFEDIHPNRNISADGILLPPSCKVRSGVCDSKGNKWLATNEGLWVLWANRGDNVAEQIGPDFGVIKTLDVGADGTLYLGTEHQGLLSYKDDKVLLLDSTTRKIEMVCLDADRLWMSTGDGRLLLYGITKNKLNDRTADCGLTGDAIVSMVASQGNVWVLSNQNLIVYSYEKPLVSHIKPTDLEQKPTQFHRLYTDMQGDVYLLTDKGIYAVQLMPSTEEYEMPAKVRLSCYSVNGAIRFHVSDNGVDGQQIWLAPDERDVQLFFSTLDLLNARNTRFAYRLHGENDWQYLEKGHNDILFTHLSRGEQQLEVIATNANGRWNNEVFTLTIHCEPHWWETTWAMVAYALILCALICAHYYWRNRKKPLGR